MIGKLINVVKGEFKADDGKTIKYEKLHLVYLNDDEEMLCLTAKPEKELGDVSSLKGQFVSFRYMNNQKNQPVVYSILKSTNEFKI